MISPFELLTIALATLYLSFSVTKTHGPYHVFVRLRQRTTFGGLLECIVCAAFWIGIAFYALWQTPAQPVVTVFAVAGAATLLSFYTGMAQQ